MSERVVRDLAGTDDADRFVREDRIHGAVLLTRACLVISRTVIEGRHNHAG